MKKKLSTMIVGFGKVSSYYDSKMGSFFPYQNHFEVIKNHPKFELTAIIDKSEKVRRKVKKQFKVPIVLKSINQLSKDYVPDIVVISTKPESKYKVIKNLRVGKAILLEKPVGKDLKDSMKIFEKCKDLGVLVQVNLLRRADKTEFLQKKNLLKFLGKVQFVNVVYGNGIKNNGVHIIDFLRLILGEVQSVRSFSNISSCKHATSKNDFDIFCKLNFEKNISVIMSPINFNFYRDIIIDIWGNKGRVEIFQEGLFVRKSKINDHRAIENYKEISIDSSEIIKTKLGTGYYNIYDNLYDAIFNRKKLVSSLDNTIQNEKVIDAIIRCSFNKNKKIHNY
tara:strand:+ start:488 stop:1498 length:1011 start_codon:yes stop_codon:yes gene_type:complete